MKKHLRITAVLLALVMLCTCPVTSAFAATSQSVCQYGSEDNACVLFIGDSLSRGEGTDYNVAHDGEYGYWQWSVPGSYPNTVAESIGCDLPDDPAQYRYNTAGRTFYNCSFNGMSLNAFMGLLDGDAGGLVNLHSYSQAAQAYFLDEESNHLPDLIEKANLIVVELGLCDVFWEPFYRAAENCGLLEVMNSGELEVSDVFEDPARFAGAVTDMCGMMYRGYYTWKSQYPMLLSYLQEHNRNNATIVMVGSCNLVAGVSLVDNSLVKTGDVFSVLTDSMNACYRQWAREYGVLYADISTLRSLAGKNGWSATGEMFWESFSLATHPDQSGHNQIAQAILNVLPETAAEEPQPPAEPVPVTTTDIVLDLGQYSSVQSVKVCGHTVTDYTVCGHTLTIPCDRDNVGTAVVTVSGADGATFLRTYELSYGADGYTARCISTVPLAPHPDGNRPTPQNVIYHGISLIKSILSRWFGK